MKNEKNESKNTPSASKKPTNRDVARLAGVSVATVSYVINGKEGQSISEATKKKVYQAMNFLNYMPNPYAVGLNTAQPNYIMVKSGKNVFNLAETELLLFLREFNSVCEEKGYQLIYSLSKKASRIAANACVCFDMTDEEFHAFAAENYIPVIALDSLIDDPVFFQITTDYEKVKANADAYFKGENYTYVALLPQNQRLKNKIEAIFPFVRFVSSVADVKDIRAKNIVLTQQALFEVFDKTDFNVLKHTEHLQKRLLVVLDCIAKALDRLNVADTDHFLCL